MIDARGLSCPEPVIMTMEALKSHEKEYEIVVDNRTSVENITRFAEHSGYCVSVSEHDGEYVLTLNSER